jgi:hypothetical protein
MRRGDKREAPLTSQVWKFQYDPRKSIAAYGAGSCKSQGEAICL